ncbi:MAG: 4-alpha-glucanotransferase, partial [Casimicrobiaceae bacterium]
MTEALQHLARAHGIALEHDDNWGRVHRVSEVTLRAVLSAMHVDATDDDAVARALIDVERARWQRRLAPLSVVRSPARPWRLRICLPAEAATRPLTCRIIDEAGIEHIHPVAPGEAIEVSRARIDDASLIEFELALDVSLPDGYHEIALLAEGETLAQGALAVVPRACYRSPSLRDGRRVWGAAVQLYGLRSGRNWGIGDFTDLAALIEQWGAEGAMVVGVSPLHALYSHDPARASPYCPSSRHFLNILFLDVEAIPEFEHCAEACAYVASPAVRHQLAKLRAVPLVDYPRVANAKLTALAMVYEQALRDARAGASPRAAQFAAFKAAAGERLRRYALFEALQAHFFRCDPEVWGWPVWPDAYRHPAAPAVRHFEVEHAERVDFHAWLQWQAALQRANVAARARKHGLELGLYADLAVSVDRGGADAWANQDLYALGAGVGAPPDAFNLKGQDWGLPPMIPQRLRDAGYEPFIAILRANMRDAGALRIDHVMGLLRLYWVPS